MTTTLVRSGSSGLSIEDALVVDGELNAERTHASTSAADKDPVFVSKETAVK
jgi:hypothetical protein